MQRASACRMWRPPWPLSPRRERSRSRSWRGDPTAQGELLPGAEGIPRLHAHSIACSRGGQGRFEVETVAGEHAAECRRLDLVEDLAVGIEDLDEQAHICHAASTVVVDIARIDRGAFLRESRLRIDAEPSLV